MARPPAPIADGLPRARADTRTIERARACGALAELLKSAPSFEAAARILRRRDPALPSTDTLRRWYRAWTKGGAQLLADARRGRRRLPYGWEARALELWRRPTQPAYATVAWWLRDEGHVTATNDRVRRYLQSLPAPVGGRDAPARVGTHWYRQNVTPHVLRDASVVPVGLIYQGDGHLCRTYIAHPFSGRRWRPELTVWICVRCHFVAGWWLSEAESAISTLHSLSRAFLAHDHVPGAIHTDPGSGFRNRLLQDDVSGWLTRVGVALLPGLRANPRGQGLVEGWWRWYEERCGKRFATWGGAERTDRALQRLEARIRRGEIALPGYWEYARATGEYVDSYNATPQPGLGGRSPADLWAEGLERSPVEVPEEVLLSPAEEHPVRKGGVEIFGRLYRAPELRMLDSGTIVLVEYDLTDERTVRIVWKGRLVCTAALVSKKPWARESRIADLRESRRKGRERRLERKIEEVRAQARPVIDGAHAAEAAAIAAPDAPALPDPDDIDPYDSL